MPAAPILRQRWAPFAPFWSQLSFLDVPENKIKQGYREIDNYRKMPDLSINQQGNFIEYE